MPRPRRGDLYYDDLDEFGIKVTLRQRKPGGPIQLDCADGPGEKRARFSLGTTDAEEAMAAAREFIRGVAKQRMGTGTAIVVSELTIGQLFDRFRYGRLPRLSRRNREAYRATLCMFEAVWPRSFRVVDIDQTCIDAFAEARGRGGLVIPSPGGLPCRLEAAAAQTIFNDCARLRSVFGWAMKQKVDGVWLLESSPFLRLDMPPREKNPKQPISSHRRYELTMRYADRVDPSGRFRLLLFLARLTGHRISSVRALRVGDILFTVEQVRAKLAEIGRGTEDWADLWPHGALAWDAAKDKMGIGWVVPMGPHLAAVLRTYLDGYGPRFGSGDVLRLPTPGAVLFPAERDPRTPLSRGTVSKWLERAEEVARRDGHHLPKLAGGLWHPFRRLWRSERTRFHDKNVAAVGGWLSSASMRDAINQGYFQDPLGMLEVALFDPAQEETRAAG